ncbi:hypothetical protein DUI87_24699 [Hirundo rustica rustica]|uniref:Uncharacterized protein n=1 Tax=Hirundo rustica rustica TaxID=333673 RepID=A0A3M0JC02_HIRRU|nr:hypothetical protein DUI87_24699 [Hirundo rustica rustica]
MRRRIGGASDRNPPFLGLTPQFGKRERGNSAPSTWSCWSDPEESMELLLGLELIWSQAGRAGNVPLERRRIQGELRVPKGAPGELERGWGQGMEGQDTGNGFRVGKGRFGWDIGKEFLSGLEFPKKLWLPLEMSKARKRPSPRPLEITWIRLG